MVSGRRPLLTVPICKKTRVKIAAVCAAVTSALRGEGEWRVRPCAIDNQVAGAARRFAHGHSARGSCVVGPGSTAPHSAVAQRKREHLSRARQRATPRPDAEQATRRCAGGLELCLRSTTTDLDLSRALMNTSRVRALLAFASRPGVVTKQKKRSNGARRRSTLCRRVSD